MSTARHGIKGLRDVKGFKAALPVKPCVHCARPMSWRKAWAKNWDEVKYCSDACRRGRVAAPSASGPVR